MMRLTTSKLVDFRAEGVPRVDKDQLQPAFGLTSTASSAPFCKIMIVLLHDKGRGFPEIRGNI
jgi:hypothetical protein